MIGIYPTLPELLDMSYKEFSDICDELKKDGVTSDDIRRLIVIMEYFKYMENVKANERNTD